MSGRICLARVLSRSRIAVILPRVVLADFLGKLAFSRRLVTDRSR
jgi:hypothetical protein